MLSFLAVLVCTAPLQAVGITCTPKAYVGGYVDSLAKAAGKPLFPHAKQASRGLTRYTLVKEQAGELVTVGDFRLPVKNTVWNLGRLVKCFLRIFEKL